MVILYYVTGPPFTRVHDDLELQNLYHTCKSHMSRGYHLEIGKKGGLERKIGVFQSKKHPFFGPWTGITLCHTDCNIGHNLSFDILKLSEYVRRTFCKVSQALDWTKRTSGSRDTIFSAKTRPLPDRLRKGLSNQYGKMKRTCVIPLG